MRHYPHNNLPAFVLAAVLTAFFPSVNAQSGTEWQDPAVNEVNRLPMHTACISSASDGNRLSLNGQWKFHWVSDADSRPADFFRPAFDDSSWGEMPVPGIWELNGYGDPLYVNAGYAWYGHADLNPPVVPSKDNHVGSYRRMIDIPASWKGRQIIAHFGSVTSNMYLWVNGKFVGYSEDSKLEAEFDLTRFVKPGQNLIAFQVFRWCDGSYLEDQDFWRLSGVARDCYLYARSQSDHIQDIRVTPGLDADYRDGRLQVDLQIKGGDRVELTLTDPEGTPVAHTTVKAAPRASALIEVENPAKWTAETPCLYTLQASLKKGGKTIETIPVRVGFRQVEIKDSQLLVNGQPILIKGVDRHELDPDGGYVVSRGRMLQDLLEMKKMNVNAVRTSHYPDDDLWYDLCDEVGIYVVAEANVESHGMGYGEHTLARRDDYALAHLQRNRRNVQRNFNHPSVIVWSLGNEAGFGPNFEACYRWIKAEDPSRPVQFEQARQNQFTDIFCPMYYPYDRCRQYCEDTSKDKPLIQCEYAHAMGNSLGGFAEYWELVRRYPRYQGGFIWDFVDQGLRAYDKDGRMYYAYGGDYNDYDPSDKNFCDNGLLDPDRRWHPHAYEVQYYYQDIWCRIDSCHGQLEVFNEHFFRDLSPYRLEWTLLDDGRPVRSGVVEDLSEIGPRQKASFDLRRLLGEGLPDGRSGECFLSLRFVLRQADGLLPAGTVAARQQFLLSAGSQQAAFVGGPSALTIAEGPSKVSGTAIPQLSETDGIIEVSASDWKVIFNKSDGWLASWLKGRRELLAQGTSLRPNFWRAPTDNDYGARIQQKQWVWRQPDMELKTLETAAGNGTACVTATYDLPQVQATLILSYTLNALGQMQVTEQMQTRGEGQPDLFRFGMRLCLPADCDRIEYYGRGPMENYADRKGCAQVGIWQQTVDEQFHPYIRPQENGNKSDIRWWRQTGWDGHGLKLTADSLFSVSALRYTQESLDEGWEKQQGHSPLVEKAPFVTLCIDQSQMGLGCVNSWGAWPLPQYRIPYGNRSFSFVLEAL